MNNNIHIHQIFYNDATRAQLDAGFIALDNTENARPDWYEYWPMRQFLLNNDLDESAYYGFLSPSFGAKTGLSSSEVFGFIEQKIKSDVDAFVFSPFWAHAAYFRNVFTQGDISHKGLMSAAQEFLRRADYSADLNTLMTHSQNTAYSNYVVAKPAFWRAWLKLTGQLFTIAEELRDDYARDIATPVFYWQHPDTPMKVFLQERIATLLLATQPYKVVAYETSSSPTSLALLNYNAEHKPALIICDALKQAYTQTGHALYEAAYLHKIAELELNFN